MPEQPTPVSQIPISGHRASDGEDSGRGVRVCVVGAGTRFLSGISYYTNRLVNALGERHRVSAILIRQMMPTRLYPGRERVGKALTHFEYPADARVLDGIDWYWVPSIIRAFRLLWDERPQVIVFQWWTGTVLHSYLLLSALARLLGARLLIEFHEVLDTAELQMGLASRYVRTCAPWFIRQADGFIVHNEFDRQALNEHYRLGKRPVALVPHGPYDQYARTEPVPAEDPGVCRLLYFGVIRPFKGVEDIVSALELLSPEEARRFDLTVVGETWEGWTTPADRIAASPYRDRITFVNRYVDDQEVAGFFARADAVVLPYHRSSASGPLHLAMASGLPVIVSAVGGLIEASEGYEGAIRVPPQDPQAIRSALEQVYEVRGRRFADVHSWSRTTAGYDELFDRVGAVNERAAR
jgi:glycosyltransferase involved in cell wall biosynthesis